MSEVAEPTFSRKIINSSELNLTLHLVDGSTFIIPGKRTADVVMLTRDDGRDLFVSAQLLDAALKE